MRLCTQHITFLCMPYEIRIGEGAEAELRRLRVFDQRIIVAAIREHLTDEPTTETKRRKRLVPTAETEAAGVAWELKVGAFRVYYAVNETEVVVLVVKIERKGRKTTKETL